MKPKPKNDAPIVVIGGGTGLANLVKYLIEFFSHITIIVTMFDSGSVGGVLQVGDIRKALSALIPSAFVFLKRFIHFRFQPDQSFGDGRRIEDMTVGELVRHATASLVPEEKVETHIEAFFLSGQDAEIFQRLFSFRAGDAGIKNDPSKGIVLTNVIITALAHEKSLGSLEGALEVMHRLFRIPEGMKVMPVTLAQASLMVELKNSTRIIGQKKIDLNSGRGGRSVRRVWLHPTPAAYPPAVKAILDAAGVIIAPGTFWTSVVPPAILHKIRHAIRTTRATLIMITNILTDPRQPKWTAIETVDRMSDIIGRDIASVVCNDPELLPVPLQLQILQRGEELGQVWEFVKVGKTDTTILVIKGQYISPDLAAVDSKKVIGHWRSAVKAIVERRLIV